MNQRKLKTLDYYNQHSKEFIDNTLNVDMASLYNKFLPLLPPGGKILDIGCGPGRDALAFKNKGFYVEAFDGSEALVQSAKTLTGLDIKLSDFESFSTQTQFDGLWACASLLHLSNEDLKKVIPQFLRFLKHGGVFYLSFKFGEGEEDRGGRYFNFLNNSSFEELIRPMEVSIKESWITEDLRPRRDEKWLNVVLQKKN